MVQSEPSAGSRPRPAVLVFDVNETLSDMTAMADRFEDVGAPGLLAKSWFAGLLRDGFALTATGDSAPFADIGTHLLRVGLGEHELTDDLDGAVEHIMNGFGALAVHPDVPEGIRALDGLGIRLVTLSNGAAGIAHRLLTEAGVRDRVEHVLSVEDAGIWKPAAAAYRFALDRCGVVAAEAMMVAVHPWDIHGAAQAGLGTAWINREGAPYPAHFRSPGLEATSLVHLAELLEESP